MKFIIKFIFLLLCYIKIANCLAAEISPFIAAEEAVKENLQMPKSDPDGRIQSLNKKGAMSPKLDQISKTFIALSNNPNSRLLEIGAGYRLAAIEALRNGAKDFTVNDLDERHLKILARTVKQTNPEYLDRIKLISGFFPKETNLPETYYDEILIARVLHFMNPAEVIETVNSIYKILKPGGKVYAIMLSPYVKGFASFIPEFEKRLKAGDKFPGYVENLKTIADKNIIPAQSYKNLDKSFLFFYSRTAKEFFEQAGFIIEKAVEMPLAYPSKFWQLDGRENIGIIAQKPL